MDQVFTEDFHCPQTSAPLLAQEISAEKGPRSAHMLSPHHGLSQTTLIAFKERSHLAKQLLPHSFQQCGVFTKQVVLEARRKDHHLDPLFVPICIVCNFIELQGTERNTKADHQSCCFSNLISQKGTETANLWS